MACWITQCYCLYWWARTRGSRNDFVLPVHCLQHVTVSSRTATNMAWLVMLSTRTAAVTAGKERHFVTKQE